MLENIETDSRGRKSRPLAEMETLAEKFVRLIRDCCEDVMICGSIRRRKNEVHDIDVVAIPKIGKVRTETVFGFGIDEMVNLLHKRVDRMLSERLIVPRIKKDGTSMIGLEVAFVDFEGAPLDLYYASNSTWWGLVQMRTGSAKFNTRLATYAINLGMRYHADGKGVTKDNVRVDDGQSEASIFSALGLKYVPPEERD